MQPLRQQPKPSPAPIHHLLLQPVRWLLRTLGNFISFLLSECRTRSAVYTTANSETQRVERAIRAGLRRWGCGEGLGWRGTERWAKVFGRGLLWKVCKLDFVYEGDGYDDLRLGNIAGFYVLENLVKVDFYKLYKEYKSIDFG